MSTLSLKNLLVASKETTIEMPGMPGFNIKLAFLSRETLQKLRKKATKTTYKNRQPVDQVDDDLFLQIYVNSVVLGWTGLKLKYLADLAPINVEGADPEAELEYSPEEALDLMKASTDFDNFVSEKVSELGNFTATK